MGPTENSPDFVAWRELIEKAQQNGICFPSCRDLASHLNSCSRLPKFPKNESSSAQGNSQVSECVRVFSDSIIRTYPLQASLTLWENNYISIETASRLSLDTKLGSRYELFWYKPDAGTGSIMIQKSIFIVAKINHQVELGVQGHSSTEPSYHTSTGESSLASTLSPIQSDHTQEPLIYPSYIMPLLESGLTLERNRRRYVGVFESHFEPSGQVAIQINQFAIPDNVSPSLAMPVYTRSGAHSLKGTTEIGTQERKDSPMDEPGRRASIVVAWHGDSNESLADNDYEHIQCNERSSRYRRVKRRQGSWFSDHFNNRSRNQALMRHDSRSSDQRYGGDMKKHRRPRRRDQVLWGSLAIIGFLCHAYR